MKKIFALILTTTLLFACQNNKESYVLKGDASGYADGTNIIVQTYSFKDNFALDKDTLTVKDGKFSGTFRVSKKPIMNILRVENERDPIIYFPEDVDLKATIYKDSLTKSFVEGGKQNKMYKDYMKQDHKFLEKRQELIAQYQRAQENEDAKFIALLQSKELNMMEQEAEYRKEFIKTQPKSIFTIMILSGMVNSKEINSKDAFEYLESLEKDLAQMENVKELKSKLEKMQKADIGAKAPEFSGPTPDGETLALSDALGKYTIIDFWASWCKPCRVENPNVVEAYKKYHDQGLNIISVSLDRENERAKWLQAIEDDEMDWYHISNLQFWNDPIVTEYNVRGIPATFLLDENGIIIDKDLRGAALHAKMATLFEDK